MECSGINQAVEKSLLLKANAISRENGSGKGPVHEVRFGRTKAAVWENSTENGVCHNLTISRVYKDGN